MSFRGDDNSISDRLRLDYAPTSRASCKGCGRGIAQDEVRCGVKVRSAFHDGFDTHFHHAECGMRQGASGPASIKGFGRLRWSDQARLAEALRQPLDSSKPAVAKVKRLTELVWQVYDLIASVSKKQLREALDANDRFVTDKMSPYDLAYTIADGVVCGLLPPCPFCKCTALVGEGGQIRCSGFAAGTTTCTFTAVLESVFGGAVDPEEKSLRVARCGAFELTAPLARALKSWAMPKDAPAAALVGGAAGAGAVAGPSAAAGSSSAAGSSAAGISSSAAAFDLDAESEYEAEPPPEYLMARRRVAGSAKHNTSNPC